MIEEHNDAAQLERTVLAWNRTALAVAANGALVARAGFERNLIPVASFGFALVALGAALWFLSAGRYASATRLAARHLIAWRRRATVVAAAFVGLLSAVDLALIAT